MQDDFQRDFKSANPDKNYEKAYASAMRILGMRQHSVAELKKKLEQREYSEQSIAKVIAEMLSARYLNDTEFAISYIRSAQMKLNGEARIRQELKQKGVSSNIIEEAYFELSNEIQTGNFNLGFEFAGSSDDGSTSEINEAGELERAIKLAEKGMAYFKINTELEDKSEIYNQKQKIKAKLFRKLAGKGYSADIIFKAVDAVLKKNQNIWGN